jgi:NAD(P)-dependent dehydrogenase (short-subunit alcohol dehydrogenase family)
VTLIRGSSLVYQNYLIYEYRMSKNKTALIIGASRGLGFALAQEFLKRGWNVTGTAREKSHTHLHDLAHQNKALTIESIDITDVSQIAGLKSRLSGKTFDLLFVNAGITNPRHETIGEVSTEEFTRVMITNSLSPMRVVEELTENVSIHGTIGVMSSGQGSVADNEKGEFEVYRASKAALNMLMRSFAARRGKDRSLLLLAPGWIKTDMGGDDAKFTIEETIPKIVDTLVAQEGKKGLQYLDRFGQPVRW